MTLKTILAAITLSVVPALAFASPGCGHGATSASSCPTGQVFDATSQTCVVPSTS